MTTKAAKPDRPFLLPKAVKPMHYDLSLTPAFSEPFEYSGKVSIQLQVVETTNTIVLHSTGLTIKEGSVSSPSQGTLEPSEIKPTGVDRLSITLPKSLPAGEVATLNLIFTGVLRDAPLCGFYRSSYEHEGKVQWMPTTQMEPVDCRRAFPCFDEPALKATFSITLTYPDGMTALSNMPSATESVDPETKLRTTTFAKTPIMSTYLVAFAVSYMDYIETTSEDGILFRVYTTPGKSHLGKFALDVGARVLTYFNQFYGTPYPLPKCDMLAVPDFSAGAMENWGLVTYREIALLCDLASASAAAKYDIAYTVAHELAHQWFGDLVTMEWWTDLWLNEGFATFVGVQAVDHLFPEWDCWTRFAADYANRALLADGLRTSHPVEIEMDDEQKIQEIFDFISYMKGACVIRQIEHFIGQDAYKAGLRSYIETFKYSNASTSDLWEHLSKASGMDVASIMSNWTQKIGYPLVTIEETSTPGKFKVSQRRYLAAGLPTAEEDSTIWTIDLSVITENNKKPQHIILDKKEDIVTIDVGPNEWLKLNSSQAGLYRVDYSPTLQSRLGKAILEKQLLAVDRLGQQADAFALARCGVIPLSQALALVQNYKEETDFTVWKNIWANLSEWDQLIAETDGYPAFCSFVVELFSKIATTVGWDQKSTDSDLTRQLRALVLLRVVGYKDEASVKEGYARYQKLLTDRSSTPIELWMPLFKAAMIVDPQKSFDEILGIYKSATQPEERVRSLSGLAMSNDPATIKRALDLSLSSDVRTQDIFYILLYQVSNIPGRDAVWEFLKASWPTINAKFEGSMIISTIIKDCLKFSTAEMLADIDNFFSAHSVTHIQRALDMAKESIKTNIGLLDQVKTDAAPWLKSKFSAK